MNRTTKRLTAILLALCLLFGGVGLAPEIASTSGSLIAKAKVKKYTRYVKTSTLKVHKQASASSKVVVTLKKDKKVTQYGSANKKGWVKICYKKNQYGYVKKANLKKHPDIKALEKKEFKKIVATATKYGWTIKHKSFNVHDDGSLNSLHTITNDKWYIDLYVHGSTFVWYDINIFKPKNNLVNYAYVIELSDVLRYLKKYATSKSPLPSPSPDQDDEDETNYDRSKLNKSDVAILENLIKQVNNNGGTVPTDVTQKSLTKTDSDGNNSFARNGYIWEKGRLTKIDWENCNVKGSLSFAGLDELQIITVLFGSIDSVDVSTNKKLEALNISECNLESVDVSNNPELRGLELSYNRLKSLDVSNNPKLVSIGLTHNQVTTLDLKNNTVIQWLYLQGNPLQSLDVSANTKLRNLTCHETSIRYLDLTNNTALRELIVDPGTTLVGCPEGTTVYGV